MPESAKGPHIILLHAFPLDGRIWREQAERLAIDYRVIVPDLRGFGTAYDQMEQSSEIPIDLVAADVVGLLDDIGIERAVVGGISRGGYVALAFARHYADRLSGLMLFDTRATPADDKEGHSTRESIERLGSEGIACLPEIMRSRLFGKTGLSNSDLLAFVDGIMLSQKPDAVAAAWRGMINRADQRPILSGIVVPALALAGEEDGAFESTRAIAEQIPRARFVPIPEAGHLSMLDQPHLVNAAIRSFLTAHWPV